MSSLFLRTLRDDPADAEVDSHRLLVRAGYIRRIAAGLYAWLPLGTPGAAQGRADRARGDGPRRCAGDRAADPAAARTVATLRSRRGVRAAHVPAARPQGDRLLPVADRRGGRDDDRRAGVHVVPRPPGEPVPDQLEVPRRAAPALRPAPQPRVPDEGRVLVRRRPRRPARELPARCTTRTTASSSAAGSRSVRSKRSPARSAAT